MEMNLEKNLLKNVSILTSDYLWYILQQKSWSMIVAANTCTNVFKLLDGCQITLYPMYTGWQITAKG